VGRAERERLDQRREAVRVVRQAEIRGHIGGVARARLVPGHDGELVRQRGELRPPQAAIRGGAVYEHQRRPLADALVGDLESVRQGDPHRRNLHPGRRRMSPNQACHPRVREGRRARRRDGWRARRRSCRRRLRLRASASSNVSSRPVASSWSSPASASGLGTSSSRRSWLHRRAVGCGTLAAPSVGRRCSRNRRSRLAIVLRAVRVVAPRTTVRSSKPRHPTLGEYSITIR
jgi:hypothetical protein